MFGRANWAIVGLAKDSLETFRSNLEDRGLMIAVSQLAASAVTRHSKVDAVGINPFSAPRLDEQHPISLDAEQELARYAGLDSEARSSSNVSAEVLEAEGFGLNPSSFEIHSTLPWFGLWAVANQWKDVSDLASIKEQHSYSALERPYKFLAPTDKKNVDGEIKGITAAVRKQLPVLVDFNEGRVYIESGSKKAIYGVIQILQKMGAEIIPVGWVYNGANWPGQILSKLYEARNI